MICFPYARRKWVDQDTIYSINFSSHVFTILINIEKLVQQHELVLIRCLFLNLKTCINTNHSIESYQSALPPLRFKTVRNKIKDKFWSY